MLDGYTFTNAAVWLGSSVTEMNGAIGKARRGTGEVRERGSWGAVRVRATIQRGEMQMCAMSDVRSGVPLAYALK